MNPSSSRKKSRRHLQKGRNRNGHGTLCSFTAVCNATRECNSVYLDKAIKRETIGERTWGITRPYFHRPLMNRACISVTERRTRPRERNPGVLGDGGMLTARVSWSICAWIARLNGKSGPPQSTWVCRVSAEISAGWDYTRCLPGFHLPRRFFVASVWCIGWKVEIYERFWK